MRRPSDKNARLALLILILAALLGGTYYLTVLALGRTADVRHLTKKIDSIVSATLASAEVPTHEVSRNRILKRDGKFEWEQIEVLVTLDESHSIYELRDSFLESLSLTGVVVRQSEKSHSSQGEVLLMAYFHDRPVYQILFRQKHILPSATPHPAPRPPSARVALVVDDVGYDLNRALALLNLRRPMTISIFPQLRHSKRIAEVAHEMGYEVMMHLPMEPGEKLRRNPGFIEQGMTDEQLRWVLDRDFESVPYVVGVNNHQGSKMTADPVAMARVMRYLAEKDLFFIDSRTSSESVAYEVARSHGLAAAENDIFLDNEKDVEYIKGRIHLLIQEAKQKGQAIGICHVHPATVQALTQMFPVFDEKDIELVYASELVQ
ncbi:MAG: hypothetical protein Kow0099_10960 [Candidatus Abyssubacteria bacterium]